MMRALLVLALFLTACESPFADPSREYADPVDRSQVFEETIHVPQDLGIWDSPIIDDPKVPKRAACGTCHGPNPQNFGSGVEGERFHTTVTLQHGTLVCDQCHDADRTVLHLASGEQLPFEDLIRLCGQCHGPQFSDFQHGAHGGVNGYWDRHQGPRMRNNCIDCHAPHAPRIPMVMPVFKPRDRFMGHGAGHGAGHEAAAEGGHEAAAEGGHEAAQEGGGHEAAAEGEHGAAQEGGVAPAGEEE